MATDAQPVDPAEQLRHDEQMIRQAGEALIKTGDLILGALYLQHYALLDWPEICGYILETCVWAAESAGTELKDIRESLLAVNDLDRQIKEHDGK